MYLDSKTSFVGNMAVSSHPCGHSKGLGSEQKWPLHVLKDATVFFGPNRMSSSQRKGFLLILFPTVFPIYKCP